MRGNMALKSIGLISKGTKINPIYVLFFICLLIFTSCDKDVTKNKSRKGLGHLIPKGSIGIVTNKYTKEFNGEGFEVNYYMELNIYDNQGQETEASQLITNHDYHFIHIGDTLTIDSSRNKWLKNYGKERDEAIMDIIIYALITLGVFIVSALFAESEVFFDFKYTKLGYFMDQIIKGSLGIKASIILFLLSIIIINIVFGMLEYELIGKCLFTTEKLKLNGTIILIFSLIVLCFGLQNFPKNMRVLAIGVIIIGLLIIVLNLTTGLSLEYMLKGVFGKLNTNP